MTVTVRQWIRALINAGLKPYGRAGSELITIGLVSLLPIVIASLGIYLDQDFDGRNVRDFWTIIVGASLSGQLFFYSMSFIGSICWYAGMELDRPFPLRLYFVIPCIVGVAVASIYISRMSTLGGLPVTGIGIISSAMYVISALLYFIILAFRAINEVDFDQVQRAGETRLQEQVEERRRERG